MRSLNVKSKFGNYEIKFHDNIMSIINEINDSVVIVDSKVNELYKDYLPKNTITFDCTETNKTLIGASDLFKELIKRKIKSNGKSVYHAGRTLPDSGNEQWFQQGKDDVRRHWTSEARAFEGNWWA